MLHLVLRLNVGLGLQQHSNRCDLTSVHSFVQRRVAILEDWHGSEFFDFAVGIYLLPKSDMLKS